MYNQFISNSPILIPKKIDNFLGDLSYPIYLNHAIPVFIVTSFNIKYDNLSFSFIILLTILFSHVMVIVFDRPTLRLKK